MKDIVINTLEEVLKKEKKDNINGHNKADIVAYVLNRVPPLYVTSERGLLYGMMNTRYKTQQHVDILLLIYEAIQKIINRRDSNNSLENVIGNDDSFALAHIVGQVLEESTLAIIPDVQVTLMSGAARAAMVDTVWDNPYRTNLATKGHYHFWPKYSRKEMGTGSSARFTITFTHPQCDDQSIDVDLDVIQKNDFGKSVFIPVVLMKSK
jgi:competence protein ComFB